MDTLTLVGGGVTCNQTSRKIENLLKEGEVGFGKIVVELAGIAFGERGVLVHPPLDIHPASLDELPCEALPVSRTGRRDFEALEGWVQKPEERAEFLRFSAVRGGGKEDEVLVRLGGDVFDQRVPLHLGGCRTLRAGAGMGLVHDDELGALADERRPAGIGLDVVDRENLERIVLVNRRVSLDLAVEAGLGVRADHDRLDADLVTDFLLPLVAQMREADDGEAGDFPAVEKLAHDKEGFNGFADSHVVGDKQPHAFLAQGHDEGNHLVAPWPKRNAG